MNVDEKTALEYRQDYADALSQFKANFVDWWIENNVEPSPYPPFYQTAPKYFGIYHCPAALDYVECGARTGDWIRVDQAVRQTDDDNFALPSVLANKPGKLIYFSLGSIGSINVELMKRLIGILSRSPHRFSVSKGPRGDEIDLPENMWGENYVNQIKILPIVDLVITHGGQNTIIETVYHAKPLIVIPIFCDQLDNAQRVAEKNIGRRIYLWDFDDDKLLQAIDEALADEEMKIRLKEISQVMKTSDSRTKAAELIEDLIVKTKV